MEPLAVYLAPKGEVPGIGPEKGRAVANGIAVYKDPYGSARYVLYRSTVPIAVLQVVSHDKKHGIIANVYTLPAYRRLGYAAKLLHKARQDFVEVKHAHESMLSTEGKAFSESVRDFNPKEAIMTATKKRALASLERAWIQHFKSGSLRAKHGGNRVPDAMEAAFRAGATDSEINRIIDRAGERTARHRGEQYRKYSATGGERRDPASFGESYISAFSKSPSKPAKKKPLRQSLSRAETKARHAQKAAMYLSKGRLAEAAGEDSTAAIWYLKGSQEYAKAGSKTRATQWYRRGKELQYPEKAREMGTLYRGPYPKRHAQPKRSTYGKSVYKLKYKNVRRDPGSRRGSTKVYFEKGAAWKKSTWRPGYYIVVAETTKSGMNLIDEDRLSRAGERAYALAKTPRGGALWVLAKNTRPVRARRA